MGKAKKPKRVEKKRDQTQKRKCGKCGSGQVYVRIKDRSVVCRCCGNIDQIEDK